MSEGVERQLAEGAQHALGRNIARSIADPDILRRGAGSDRDWQAMTPAEQDRYLQALRAQSAVWTTTT